MESSNNIKRISDLLEFVDLAFPGSTEIELSTDNRFSFNLHIKNILKSSVTRLMHPKLTKEEILNSKYLPKTEEAHFVFTFGSEDWVAALPFAFLDMNFKADQITVERVGALLRAIQTKVINPQEYQLWIEDTLLGNKK